MLSDLARLILLLTISTTLVACDRRSDTTHSDFAKRIADWSRTSGTRLSTALLRLRDGSCIDTTKIRRPWQVDKEAYRYSNGIGLVGQGRPAGLEPVPFDMILGPAKDKLRVAVYGWSMPDKEDLIAWPIAPPTLVRAHIASGHFRAASLWPESYGLQSYSTFGDEKAYVDDRRLTQCRDYGSLGRIHCVVVSKDKYWSFGVTVDSNSRGKLPQGLRLIEQDLEDARDRCSSVTS